MTESVTTTNYFDDVLAAFPSGITIVTTTDTDGESRGFTASSFCAVSSEPALVLVCIDNAASCFEVFEAADSWTINIVDVESADVAIRFATRGADKFAGNHFDQLLGEHPSLTNASVRLHCSAHAKYAGGDHLILVGQIENAVKSDREPLVYLRRRFGTFA